MKVSIKLPTAPGVSMGSKVPRGDAMLARGGMVAQPSMTKARGILAGLMKPKRPKMGCMGGGL